MQFQTEILERFWYWINERHRIYIKYKVNKEPWPWTDDPILQKYKFTNVFRELDTGTIWLREHWLEPYADHPELFFNICFYRQFNWYKTAELVGFIEEFDPEHIKRIIKRYRDEQGERVFTNAHMVYGIKCKDKVDQIIDLHMTPLWYEVEDFEVDETLRPEKRSLEIAYNRLIKAVGFGPFVTYEVVTDLRHTRYLDKAHDINTWANAGPGAVRGVNRLLGKPVPKPPNVVPTKGIDYLGIMIKLLEMQGDWLEPHVPVLELREIEHSLCEFDKYERTRTGEGRPRLNYHKPKGY